MLKIFRAMMEDGYYPKFKNNHILFDMKDDIGVVEYEDGILSVRIFFSIEENLFDLFIKASNAAMMKTFAVKPVVMDDRKIVMFSCEILCSNLGEFRKFFPRCISLIEEGLVIHKNEMKNLIEDEDQKRKSIPTTDIRMTIEGIKHNKIIS